MKTILIPIFCGCILPIAVVLISAISKVKSENERAKILIKAIEANKDVDTDKLIEALKKPRKTPLEILNSRLLTGCIFTLIGVSILIVGLVNLACGAGFSADSVSVPMLFGGISMAIGFSYLIVFFVTKKQVNTPESNIKA